MANEYVRKGFLVPDDITNDIVESASERRYPHGFMLDGYPEPAQAEALDKVLDSLASVSPPSSTLTSAIRF